MSTTTLTDRATGQTILDSFWNDIHSAMGGDFVGRNSSGVATAAQNLGTVAIPWGTMRASSLVLGGSSIDTSLITSQVNRITSGKVRTTSNQPAFITPTGSAASFILKGATTNLVVDVNGSAVTVSTDITKSSLTVAVASTNTCLVNDVLAVSQDDSRYWGEASSKDITVDTMGANFQTLIGTMAAFKIVHAGVTEYAYGFVKSTTVITKCFRGYFYDSALAPVNRVVLADNDTITMMKLGWVFVTNDGTTIDVTYTTPAYGGTQPSSPATGDYWYDTINNLWRRYDGATFVSISRVLVGMVVMDATNCVAARCLPFFARYSPDGDMPIEVATTEIVRSKNTDAGINVTGINWVFRGAPPTWNITTQLAASPDSNATEAASTTYFLYVKDTGAQAISDIGPHWHPEMYGFYHPHNPWRCVGTAYNNASSNITLVGSWIGRVREGELILDTQNGYGSTYTMVMRWTTATYSGDANRIFTYADSAAFGATIRVNKRGIYAGSFSSVSANGASDGIGISLNVDSNTSSLTGSAAQFLARSYGGGAPFQSTATFVKILESGDTLRFSNHNASAPQNNAWCGGRISLLMELP